MRSEPPPKKGKRKKTTEIHNVKIMPPSPCALKARAIANLTILTYSVSLMETYFRQLLSHVKSVSVHRELPQVIGNVAKYLAAFYETPIGLTRSEDDQKAQDLTSREGNEKITLFRNGAPNDRRSGRLTWPTIPCIASTSMGIQALLGW
jgi:hypothetical protein